MMTPQIAMFLVLAAVTVAGAVSPTSTASDSQRAVADRCHGRSFGALSVARRGSVAAVQIIVYAGAIMVLFVFVIMLLTPGRKSART